MRWSSPTVEMEIAVTLDSRAFGDHAALAAWNVSRANRAAPSFKVRASSTLAPQGGRSYPGESVTDGKPATAWCEGSEGDGVGEWVELEWRCSRQGPCSEPGSGRHLLGVVVVPGYARTQRTFTENNRVAELRIGPCGGAADAGVVHPIGVGAKVPSDVRRSAVMLLGINELGLERCGRFTIERVEAGSSARDTCIGEIAPWFHSVW